ncbi:hypothetical protein HH1059_05990 [Halorhodospira halochloris]|uniref:Uncharacterized protein n=1 Tax=Halorhodospira halochloris TaxID=1052 RepID=A0A2Z6EZE3_HALHR|nr:hypothetical protein HH1059_05990 [Halorhodospira halochloris]
MSDIDRGAAHLEGALNYCYGTVDPGTKTAWVSKVDLSHGLSPDILSALSHLSLRAPLNKLPTPEPLTAQVWSSWRQGWRHEASRDGLTAPSTPGQ